MQTVLMVVACAPLVITVSGRILRRYEDLRRERFCASLGYERADIVRDLLCSLILGFNILGLLR
jgi:hypothetical protein